MFGFFKAKPKLVPAPLAAVTPRIDLKCFSCDGIELGSPMPGDAFFAKDIDSEGIYANRGSGIELGVEEGVLDYIYITLADFKGSLMEEGRAIGFGRHATEAEVEAVFGRPFHRDVDADGEVIRFHEYRSGKIELQFEFLPDRGLEVITVCRDGVLSGEEQRRSYKVTRAWPPTDG
jgi:hypothetical protein